MDIAGEYRIPALREHVWAALNDPEILRVSIPGCQELDKRSDQEFAAKVVAKIGPVRATFAGSVTLADLDPPEAYTISGQGQGGMAGFAKGVLASRFPKKLIAKRSWLTWPERTSGASLPVSEIVLSKAQRKRWLTSFLQHL